VGRALAAAILGRSKLLSEGEWGPRTLYLNSLGEVLAERFGRPGVKHHFAWLDSDEVNAFAAPAGYIFLTRGLFEHLSSEDELAVILLHEIVHVTEQHVYKRIAPANPTGFTFVLARLLSGGRGDLGVAVSRSVSQGLKLLLESGLGQELERQADEQGVAMAASLGYDPESLVRFLGDSNFKGGMHTGAVKLPATHPPLEQRRKWIADWITAQGLIPLSKAAVSKSPLSTLPARISRFAKYAGRSREGL
jgi:predicted Zn-dependent protease